MISTTNNLHRAKKRINNEIVKCKELHYRFAKRLSRIANQPVYETLTSTKQRGKLYYSETWLENGVRRTRYIGDDDEPEVRTIKEKHFLRKSLKQLENRIQKLEKAADMLEPIDFTELNRKPKVYQLTPEHLKQVVGPTEEEKWYEAAMKQKAMADAQYGISYERELKHKAKDGTLMRSKSEVVIYNEFLERGKPCIYEMPTHVGPFVLHPDFTFFSNRLGRTLIWEHAGMLGEEDYMKSFSTRMDRYLYAGLVPCVDVIFTFDTTRGDVDTGMIKKLLDEYE